jgi:hypothetical protein
LLNFNKKSKKQIMGNIAANVTKKTSSQNENTQKYSDYKYDPLDGVSPVNNSNNHNNISEKLQIASNVLSNLSYSTDSNKHVNNGYVYDLVNSSDNEDSYNRKEDHNNKENKEN